MSCMIIDPYWWCTIWSYINFSKFNHKPTEATILWSSYEVRVRVCAIDVIFDVSLQAKTLFRLPGQISFDFIYEIEMFFYICTIKCTGKGTTRHGCVSGKDTHSVTILTAKNRIFGHNSSKNDCQVCHHFRYYLLYFLHWNGCQVHRHISHSESNHTNLPVTAGDTCKVFMASCSGEFQLYLVRRAPKDAFIIPYNVLSDPSLSVPSDV